MCKLTLLIIILLLSGYSYGASRNRNALNEDTCIISDFSADSLKYSKWFNLADKEDLVVSLKVDDTLEDGFDSDSFQIVWGYQVAVPCYDTSGTPRNERKCIQMRIAKDTMNSDSAGKLQAHVGSESSAGVVTLVSQLVDTSNVPGYAVQSRTIYPLRSMYGTFFRVWIKGLTGNSNTALEVKIDVQRRHYSNVRKR